MTRAQWRSDPNCPPENETQSKKWFERLASSTERHLIQTIKDSKQDRAALHVADTLHARSEEIKSSTFSKLTELRQAGSTIPPIACRMGCNYCCHLEVGAYPPEVIRIADHLRKTRTPKQLSLLIAKICKRAVLRAGLTKKQRSSGNVGPCPFLGAKGQCSIYEVRPLACRTYHTFNVKECEKVFYNPDKRLTVTMVVEPCDTRDALSDALEAACEKLSIPAEEIELATGVLIALKTPNAASLWRRGVDVFEEARI